MEEPIEKTPATEPRVRSGRKLSDVIWYIGGLINLVLLLRLVFLLLGAARNSFVDGLYDLTEPLVKPFQGIFNSPVTGEGAYFDTAAAVAFIVYALITWALVALIDLMTRRPTA